jgi:hypothetical protein
MNPQKPSFTRVLPPSGFLQNDNEETTQQAAQAARYERLQAAHTVEAIIGLVPDDYRSCLRPHLLEVANTTKKLCGVVGVLAKYRNHQAAGTFPPFVSKQQPSLQLTKEFAGTAEGSSHQKSLTDAHKAYCVSLLTGAIQAKEDERDHLENALSPQRLYEAMSGDVSARTVQILERSKLPVFGSNDDGNVIFLKWSDNHSATSLGLSMLQDCCVYAYRIRACVEASSDIVAAKAAAKSKLKQNADVDMAEAGPSSGIDKRKLTSMVDKAVANKLKAAKSSKKVSDALFYIASTLTVYPGFVETERQEDFERQTSGPSSRPLKRQEKRFPHEKPWKTCREDLKKVEGVVGWKGEEEEVVKLLLPLFMARAPIGGFRYDNPLSYPDFLLTINSHLAITYIILNTPVDVILASQFKNIVHKSPNVEIPLHIEHQLSVGMKYMFLQPHNTELFEDAYNDFSRRLKWRLHFALSGKGTDSIYDPDYEVSTMPSMREPKLPQYLLSGLNKGREYVYNTILKSPKTVEPHGTAVVHRKEIGDFLLLNKYIVTMTDKNLGLAVSQREWIIENCLKLLNDTNNYKYLRLASYEIEPILDEQNDEMESIASSVDEFYGRNTQLATFLRSKLFKKDEDGELVYVLPKFYGIPKIHKQPVKMRPIIPCHSAVQNPAAKYCSKMLKPLIEAAPTIIKGSKDLAIKLSKLKIDPSRKYYIITGDVVAFYPNIPLKQCIDIVVKQYADYLWETDEDDATIVFLMKLFKRCLMVGNTSLITKFQGKCYLQKRGLAMGVSDSPDLANLFGYEFERNNETLKRPEVIFYGRYIDDCLAIAYADSEEEALALAENIKFDNCVIEWSASNLYQVFLDMKLYIDNGRLQHIPYRKPNNHLERIPWLSHHPLDVKRGSYLGELSRLAVLSSQETSYHDAVNFLNGLYIVRGYPSDLVYAWAKENIQERWSKRFSDRREAEDVLVLKSVYNTAWNYFNAKELGDTIFNYWRAWLIHHDLESPPDTRDFPDEETLSPFADWPANLKTKALVPDVRLVNFDRRRIIVSRKRTRNLLDLIGLWKNTVLSQMDMRNLNLDDN